MKFKLYLLSCVFFVLLNNSCNRSPETQISVHYLGHSSFIIQFENELTVLTDFGTSNSYGLDSPIYEFGNFIPSVVTYSHVDHIDHYGRKIPSEVVNILSNCDSLTLKNLKIIQIRTSELDLDKPDNTSFLFEYKGLKILHLADAQANIKNINDENNRSHLEQILPKNLDLLLMTIEGRTQFIKEAETFINLLQPKRVIPIHYWSKKYKEDFLDYLKNKDIYQIEKTPIAQFSFSNSDKTTDRIKIISLEPAPFINEPVR